MKPLLPTFVDFFAGSGLVTQGVKHACAPVWANDICPRKAAIYTANQRPRGFPQRPVLGMAPTAKGQTRMAKEVQSHYGDQPFKIQSAKFQFQGSLGELLKISVRSSGTIVLGDHVLDEYIIRIMDTVKPSKWIYSVVPFSIQKAKGQRFSR